MIEVPRRGLKAYYYYSGYYWWAWVILSIGLLVTGFLLLFLWGRHRKRRQLQMEMQQQQAAAVASAGAGAPGTTQYYGNTTGQQTGYDHSPAGEYTYSPEGGYSYHAYSEYPTSGNDPGVVYGYPVNPQTATGSTTVGGAQK